MNLDRIFTKQAHSEQGETNALPSGNSAIPNPSSIGSIVPGGVIGGLAAGGIMALLMGSKSARKLTKKVAKVGGTAVLGGLAYKAYDNWHKNQALGKIQPISDADVRASVEAIPAKTHAGLDIGNRLIMAMIAASKSDGHFDTQEQQQLFSSVEKMNLTMQDKANVFELINQEITPEQIASGLDTDEHKAEVYLAAYLAITVDEQQERSFLNNLASALKLPKGFAAYLEQQADLGIES